MHKFMVLCAAATLGALLFTPFEASARGWHGGGYHHGGWHGGGYHHRGWHGGGFHHRGWHGGWHGGGYHLGGWHGGGYGTGCGRRWVLGPYGGHWVRRCW
jgi:hypothetical protein